MDFLPFLLATMVVMFVTGYVTSSVESLLLRLLLRIGVAGVLYMVISYICRFEELREVIAYLLRRKEKKE